MGKSSAVSTRRWMWSVSRTLLHGNVCGHEAVHTGQCGRRDDKLEFKATLVKAIGWQIAGTAAATESVWAHWCSSQLTTVNHSPRSPMRSDLAGRGYYLISAPCSPSVRRLLPAVCSTTVVHGTVWPSVDGSVYDRMEPSGETWYTHREACVCVWDSPYRAVHVWLMTSKHTVPDLGKRGKRRVNERPQTNDRSVFSNCLQGRGTFQYKDQCWCHSHQNTVLTIKHMKHSLFSCAWNKMIKFKSIDLSFRPFSAVRTPTE